MGTWKAPTTVAEMSVLALAMRQPLAAMSFQRFFGGFVGDDGLMDAISAIGGVSPVGDVRPALASVLEYWSRWTDTANWKQPWEPGARVIALQAVEDYDFGDVVPFTSQHSIPDTCETAVGKVAAVDGKTQWSDRDYQVVKIMPGVYAVHQVGGGQIYRVDCLFGLVQPCDPVLREDLIAELFGAPEPTP